MKRMMALIFVIFIVIGMLANSILVLADDSSGNTGSENVRPTLAAGQQVNNTLQNQGESGDLREMIQQRVQKAYEGRNGTRVNVSREVERMGNVTSVSITRTVTYANGTQVNYTIQLQAGNESGKPVRNLNMEREGENYNVSIDKNLNVSDGFGGNNQSYLRANLSNGKSVNISVLPDQALQAVRDRLKLQAMNNNTNISLRERVHNNVPQVVYVVQTNQNGKFLGIFKLAMKTNTEVDSNNGQVVSVSKPWWAFLVSVPQGSSTGSNETNMTNSTNESSVPVQNLTNVTNSS